MKAHNRELEPHSWSCPLLTNLDMLSRICTGLNDCPVFLATTSAHAEHAQRCGYITSWLLFLEYVQTQWTLTHSQFYFVNNPHLAQETLSTFLNTKFTLLNFLCIFWSLSLNDTFVLFSNWSKFRTSHVCLSPVLDIYLQKQNPKPCFRKILDVFIF